MPVQQNRNNNAGMPPSIRFSEQDIADFAAASSDRNPLHLDADYAHRTAYGQRLVHGAAAALSCLQHLPSQRGQYLQRLELEFRHPVLLATDYQLHCDDSTPGQAVLTLCDGELAVLKIKAGFARRQPRGQEKDSIDVGSKQQGVRGRIELRRTPAERSAEDFKAEWSLSGRYRSKVKTRWGRAPYSDVLMLASYLIGMEMPGRTALFSKLDMVFEQTSGAVGRVLDYQARSQYYEPDFGLLKIALGISNSRGTVARGELQAFVRKNIGLVDLDRVRRLLPSQPVCLSDKVALVTGASRGLGAAITQALVLRGCHVVVNYRNSQAKAECLQQQLGESRVTLRQGDAADRQWCAETRKWLLAQFGHLDILVCNACEPPLNLGSSPQALQRQQRYIAVNSALSSVPIDVFRDALEHSGGALVGISSSIMAQTAKEWPQYRSVKQALEGSVHAVAEACKNTAGLIVRPPALLTDMSNTPGRAAVAVAPELVACAIVDKLGQGLPSGQTTLLSDFPEPVPPAGGPEINVAIAANFTLDPLLTPLQGWGEHLGWRLAPRLAPYNQLFQFLLDPASTLGNSAMNVFLLRLEDWLRDRPKQDDAEAGAFLQRTVHDFSEALQVYSQRSACPSLLLLCPASPVYAQDPEWAGLLASLEENLLALAGTVPDLDVLDVKSWHRRYGIAAIDDPLRNEIAHIPFMPEYYNLLATLIVRRLYSLQTRPYKVLVVDCDNTLWGGVCGEIGPDGVAVDGPHRLLQEFLLEQKKQGMLLCLCSKNNEDDVWAVFRTRVEMLLQAEDIVAHRISWQPKSDSLKELARALNLGLDSFIFIDDNPVECAELRAHCPAVLTLEWPPTMPEAKQLLEHVWAFDHYRVSPEDRDRTSLYKANMQRAELKSASTDFASFIAGLELELNIEPARETDHARMAQLSQRTNQFNFTTRRYSVSEIRALAIDPGVVCQSVRVRDRFGDYGLVGIMIARLNESTLKLESFMLSCRVLGRGVEHAMLARLAEKAEALGLTELIIHFRPSSKNQPAQQFLEQLGMFATVAVDSDTQQWQVLVSDALQFRYCPVPGTPRQPLNSAQNTQAASTLLAEEEYRNREAQLLHIARNLSDMRLAFKQAETVLSGSDSTVSATESAPALSLAQNYCGELRDKLLQDLKALFARQLGLSTHALEPNADLENYVTDSLQNVDLTVALKRDFPAIPATFLFEHRSLSRIADTLAADYADRLAQKYALTETSGSALNAPASPGTRPPWSRAASSAVLSNTDLSSTDNKAIAIIGINGRYPQAASLQDFWNNLVAGKSCISEVPAQRWPADLFFDPVGKPDKSYCKRGGFITDVDRFDAAFFRISPKEAELTDPQQRLLLEVVWGLLEDAGYTRASISRKTGVFIGCNANDYALYANDLALQGVSAYRNADYYQIPNRISYFFDFQGPSLCVDTACSASGTSLYLACQSLRTGQCQTAIVGGINLFLHPSRFIQYAQMHMLSPSSRCSPFGVNADGTVFGEGVGALLLKPLSAAQQDGDNIYGVIRGCAINSGGKTNGFTVPNPRAQAELVAEALSDAAIDPRTITYVEAHGTGTPLGDPIEIRGLTMAFEQGRHHNELTAQHCAVGSVKANIGHLEAGAAIPGIIKILLQMKHGKLVPSLNSAQTNPKIEFETSPFYVPQRASEWQRPVLQENGQAVTYPRRAGISSFGAGGSNAHIILEEYGRDQTASGPEQPQIIVLSARTPTALKAYAVRLVDYLRPYLATPVNAAGTPPPSLAGIAYTLQTGREAMEERLALVAGSIQELYQQLSQWLMPDGHESDAALAGSTVFSANARTGKAYAERLLEGPEGADYIAQLLHNGRLSKLAELWTMGVALDWDALAESRSEQTARLRRVPLPSYPFEGERFWLPGDPGRELAQRHRKVIHPLLDAFDPRQSLGQGAVFCKQLGPAEAIIADHRVYGQTVLPAAGYLGMVQAALGQLDLPAPLRLSRLSWTRPLLIEETVVDTALTIKAEAQQWTYVISRSGDDSRVYAQGSVMPGNAARCETVDPAMLAERRARCATQLDKNSIYARFRAMGMDFGPYFQVIEQLSHNSSEAFSYIRLCSPYTGEAGQYVLHPGLLDGALQTALSLVPSDAAPALPFALEQLDLLRTPDSASVYVHAKRLDEQQRFQVEIIDEAGAVCARLHDLVLRTAADPIAQYFYLPRWRLESERTAKQKNIPEPAQVLMIATPQSRFIAQALSQYCNPAVIRQIESDAVDSLQLSAGIERIYFLGGVFTEAADIGDLAVLEQRENTGILALFRWLKVLQRGGYGERELQLRIVTNNVYAIEDDDGQEQAYGNPYAASVIGLAQVIAKEYPHWQVDMIDLELPTQAADLSAAQLQMLWQEPVRSGELTVLRGENRYTRVLEPANLRPVAGELPCKTGGVYLILGGTGGLGFEFSCYLARTVQAQLVWLGRSESGAVQQDKIAQIEALGGRALYLQADAADPDSMQRAVEQARAAFGPIQGAIHSALALDDKTLASMDERQLLAALAPKTRGSVILHHTLQGEPLDFLLFFSSINAFNTPMGQGNYVAACCFKDAFASHLEKLSPYPVKIINWGFWGQIGIAAGAEYRQQIARQGHIPLQPAEGIEAIRRVMVQDQPQVVAVKAGAEALAALGVVSPEAGMPVPALREPERDSAPDPAPGALPVAGSLLGAFSSTEVTGSADGPLDARGEHDKAAAYVKTIIAEIIRIQPDAIDGQATFDHYGLDSLLSLEISQRIERDLGRMPATLLFEHNTADNLAAFLLREHRTVLLPLLGVSAKPSAAVLPSVSHSDLGSIAKARAALELSPVSAPLPESLTNPMSAAESERHARKVTEAKDDIAIIGIAGRYPQSADLAELWANLLNARNCVRPIPPERWPAPEHYDPDPNARNKSRSQWGGFIDDADKFDALFFNIAPKDAAYMDPQERLFLETVWAAVEDAGYTRRMLEALQQRCGLGIGVFVGCMYQQYGVAVNNPEAGAMLSTSSYWYIANRVSHFFNFNGPSIAIDTACSSSLSALHMACQSIRSGECPMAVAGGVNLNLHPSKYLRLDQLGMLASGPASKSLGDGDGLVPGEGVGAVILKPLSMAIRDNDLIYGVIKDCAVNHGGRTSGFMVPNPNAQAALISAVLARSGIDPRSIDYVEVAANGSALGDPIELAGLNKAFRLYTKDRHFCAIGSVKSNLGHLEAASGLAQLSKVLLQFQHKQLVPTLNATPLNPHLDLDDTPFFVQQVRRQWVKTGPRRAAISSFGAGGSYAHVLLEDFEPERRNRLENGETQIIVLSARNTERLKAYAQRLLVFLSGGDETSASLQGQIQETLLQLTAEILQVPTSALEMDQALSEYGTDPVQMAALSERISACYEIDLMPAALFETPTLAALADYLYTRHRQGMEKHCRAERDANTKREDLPLVDIAFTLQTGRESMAERLALVVSDRDRLVSGLRAYCQGTTADVPSFQGNVSTSKNQAGLMIADQEGRDVIAELINKRRYEKLARLWVSGVDVDWSLLQVEREPEDRPRRVSLPTYPFARVRHWIDPAIVDVEALPESLPTDMPLLTSVSKPEAKRAGVESAGPTSQADKALLTVPGPGDMQQTIIRDVLQLVSELQAIDAQELDADEDLRAYGFDSIGLVKLSQRLSEHYQLPITPERFFANATIAACARSLLDDHAEALKRFYSGQHSRPAVDVGTAQTRTDEPSRKISRVKRETDGESCSDAVAIIGMAGMMPQSETLDDYWSHLLAGDELITEIPADRWIWSEYYGNPNAGNKTRAKWGSFLRDIAGFDSLFFGISPREAELMDPRQRLFLETVWNAIENAGYAADELAGSATGLYVGVGNNDYDTLLRQADIGLTAHGSTGLMINSVLANRVSYLMDLHGPSEIVDTACSGSTVALHRAVRALKLGECDLAIAGGVNILLDPRGFIMLDKSGILSADGRVRLFDENATGYVRGEGVGAVLLKPYPRALADRDHIYGLIRGGAVNHNGRNYSLTAPSPDAQASVVRAAYLDARVDPATVNYIEAQGTGSALGDPVEINAFKKAFAGLNPQWYQSAPKAQCAISYLKPNIGHLECASGIAGLIKILLALQEEKLPGVKNVCQQTAAACLQGSPFMLASGNQEWSAPHSSNGQRMPRRAGLHSFGFGGVNAHIVVEEHIS